LERSDLSGAREHRNPPRASGKDRALDHSEPDPHTEGDEQRAGQELELAPYDAEIP